MKRKFYIRLFLISLLLSPIFALAQKPMSCCARFADLGNQADFRQAHESPRPFHFETKEGKMVTYKCPDGSEAHAFEYRTDTDSKKYLFVVHEWWGLNDYIKQEGKRLYDALDHKVNVICLDLYDGKTATNSKEASALMQGVTQSRASNIIEGALNTTPQNAQIASIGWCFGGGWSLQTALDAGDKAIGCVMYYGMPEDNVNRLKKLNCDVLGFFGTQDDWITPAVVQKFKENMKLAGKHLETHSYDAPHAFANPSNPDYNKEATADANSRAMRYLKSKFKI